MRRYVKPLILGVGLLVLTALYYWELVHIDYAIVYGRSYGVYRAVMVISGFIYFWVLAGKLAVLRRIISKIDNVPSARGGGRFAIMLILGILHLVVVYFGSVQVNDYLLRRSGILTQGIIKDCRRGRQSEYCLYQYVVGNTVYQKQIRNDSGNYINEDSVVITYYPEWPAISAVYDKRN